VAALAPRAAEGARGGADARGSVVLDGARTPVRWIDGDTFRIERGPRAGRLVRLSGVNALETYGPVHRIARLRGPALLRLAREAAPLLAAGAWRCETDGAADGYGRLLVSCPAAAKALVEAGLAMVFAVDEPADAALLAAQRQAQARRVGLWAKGVPPAIPTSLHSLGERGLGPRDPYDRVVDTATGIAEVRTHRRTYAPCEEVCVGEGALRACLAYVPYDRRFRNRPSCLRRSP
jgi:endonuclease YncB( thermonuclease family)